MTELVADAYRHYEPLIGRTPLPMLIHYEDAVREHDIWVLDADGTLVGIVELERRLDHLWIENVAVAPSWQGRGLGRLLLRQPSASNSTSSVESSEVSSRRTCGRGLYC